MMKTYEDGIAAGVRFALDQEEHYDRTGNVLPPTPDHLFGDATLIIKPRRDLSKNSRNHLDQRIRAITASALADQTE